MASIILAENRVAPVISGIEVPTEFGHLQVVCGRIIERDGRFSLVEE